MNKVLMLAAATASDVGLWRVEPLRLRPQRMLRLLVP